MEKKKITKVEGDNSTSNSGNKKFVPTAESKGKATKFRVIASLLWLLAIGAQVFAITLLFKQPINMTWIIALIVIDLVLAIIGAILW